MHAGFFIGNKVFYDHLRAMPEEELAEICMTAISFTNTLDGDLGRKRADRRHVRFINTAMTVTNPWAPSRRRGRRGCCRLSRSAVT
jgi:hypothetical protein